MKLTSQIFIATCLTLLFCGQVAAEHTGPYLGVFVGGNALMPAKVTDNKGDISFKFKPAFLGSAVAGWDFESGNPVGEGRIELEYSRRSNTLDQVKFSDSSVNGSGHVTADSLLVNFWGILHDKRIWSPYMGAGIGAARIATSNLQITGQPFSNSSTFVFAYQLGAGIDLTLTKNLSLDLGYRFFSSSKPKLAETDGQKFKMDYMSHNVLLGLRVGF